jgi:ABC-2 type transport system permease protein
MSKRGVDTSERGVDVAVARGVDGPQSTGGARRALTAMGSLSRAMALGFVRDKTALFFTMFFPLMFLLIFGGLFRDAGISRSDVVQIGAVQVLDQVPAQARTDLDQVLKVERTDDRAAALEKVRKGDTDAAIEQQGSRVVLHVSGADQVKAATVRGVLNAILERANLAAAGVTQPALTLDEQLVEDESLKPIQFLTPGLIGWAVAIGATFASAMTLVTWRQKKILRRLRLAPVRTTSIIGARIGVSVVIALAQLLIFVGVGTIPYFGLKLSGYWWLSIPLVIAATLAFMSIGLLAGAWAKTPEAASAIANLIVLPMAFLSGSFFPTDAAPAWLRSVSQVFPLKHLNDAMLDVMVRGQGPASILPAIGILLGFAVVVSAVAMFLFSWDDV